MHCAFISTTVGTFKGLTTKSECKPRQTAPKIIPGFTQHRCNWSKATIYTFTAKIWVNCKSLLNPGWSGGLLKVQLSSNPGNASSCQSTCDCSLGSRGDGCKTLHESHVMSCEVLHHVKGLRHDPLLFIHMHSLPCRIRCNQVLTCLQHTSHQVTEGWR